VKPKSNSPSPAQRRAYAGAQKPPFPNLTEPQNRAVNDVIAQVNAAVSK
jgi:hypothetical protein